jgi:hypothetical protein
MHDRVSFHFVKNNIIPASPDSPAKGSHPNPDQAFDPLMLIHKPGTKHMADRSRLVQTSSKEDNPPHHFCTRAIKEQVLDGLIPIAVNTFLAPSLVFPSEVVFS